MEAAAAARRLEHGEPTKSSDLDSEDDGANLVVSLGSLLQLLEMEVRQGI